MAGSEGGRRCDESGVHGGNGTVAGGNGIEARRADGGRGRRGRAGRAGREPWGIFISAWDVASEL